MLFLSENKVGCAEFMSRFIGTCVPSATHYLFFCGGNCKFPVFLSAKLQIRQNGGLKENLEEIFDGNKIESADDLYKILDDENQFEKIFKLEEIK